MLVKIEDRVGRRVDGAIVATVQIQRNGERYEAPVVMRESMKAGTEERYAILAARVREHLGQ